MKGEDELDMLERKVALLSQIKELEEWLAEHGSLDDDLDARARTLAAIRQDEEWLNQHGSSIDDLTEHSTLAGSIPGERGVDVSGRELHFHRRPAGASGLARHDPRGSERGSARSEATG